MGNNLHSPKENHTTSQMATTSAVQNHIMAAYITQSNDKESQAAADKPSFKESDSAMQLNQ